MKNLLILLLSICMIATGSSCKKSKCENVVCQNGGTCDEATGTCTCPGGYSGKNCENHDACYGVTCYNGGTCNNGVCSCPPGYAGADCSQLFCEYYNIADVYITNTHTDPYTITRNGATIGTLYSGQTRAFTLHTDVSQQITATQQSGYIFSPSVYSTSISTTSCVDWNWSF